ncbi:retrovirus-related pol polyprotein from transposon TNT 1-94 [Tanacetum coccineum]
MDPPYWGNPRNEDEEQDEEPQQQNLDNYVLVYDKAKRTNSIHAWYRDEDYEGIEGVQKTKVQNKAVARWFTQRAWIDYNEGFLPVVRHTSIRVTLSLTACEDYELEQLDVKMAFLNGNLEETIYIRHHEWYKWLWMCKWNQKGSATAAMIAVFTSRSLHQTPDKVGRQPEAKYMALTEAVKESIWLKGLLIELRVNLRSVVVNCDNQGAIHLSRNAIFHERTKHINVRYHFIREIVESKEIEVAKIGTSSNWVSSEGATLVLIHTAI